MFTSFIDSGHDDGDAFIYATLTFFGGCILMMVLDLIVDWLLAWDSPERTSLDGTTDEPAVHNHATLCSCSPQDAKAVDKMREDFEGRVRAEENKHESDLNIEIADTDRVDNADVDADADGSKNDIKPEAALTEEDSAEVADTTILSEEGKQLTHMGWAMAASIAIHNFPEGMVTYLAYTTEPSVGIALAVGIAVHNIPEGLCVAMPLYYATGRRFYSFMWGTLSGLTEPFGALIVWLILSDGISGTANGILFGLVSGMMTVISVDELLPTAHKYASNPKHVTYSFLFGMLFIAASLMLFSI
jgi:ZIP family zinc transporter